MGWWCHMPLAAGQGRGTRLGRAVLLPGALRHVAGAIPAAWPPSRMGLALAPVLQRLGPLPENVQWKCHYWGPWGNESVDSGL